MTLIEELRSLAPWHLDIEIAPGVRTSDGNAPDYDDPDRRNVSVVNVEEMRPLFQALDMNGKSFLDVACNAGGYSLLAHSMGASRVFGFDAREIWIEQALFLKRKLKSKGIEFKVMPLKELSPATHYDVTLFKGILYHLPDPIHDLRKVCSITDETIIIDTATSSVVPEHCLEPMQESVTHVMSGVEGLAWKPGGPECIRQMVNSFGFPHARTVYWHKETSPGWGRTRVVASRKEIHL